MTSASIATLVEGGNRYAGHMTEALRLARVYREPGARTAESMLDARRWFESLPVEVRPSAWSVMMTSLQRSASVAGDIAACLWLHAASVDAVVTGTFGVPVGKAGVGVEPIYPAIVAVEKALRDGLPPPECDAETMQAARELKEAFDAAMAEARA